MPADHIIRRQISGDHGEETVREIRDDLAAQGCTWFRMQYIRALSRIVVEGWKVRPDDQGPAPIEPEHLRFAG